VEGRARCLPLAERLAGYRPTAIVASREPKATETATLVAAHLGLPHETAAGLEENDRSGFVYVSAAQYEATLAAFFARREERVLGRESAAEAEQRFTAAIHRVLGTRPEGTLLVVAHGTVITLFVARAAGIEPFPFWRRLGLPSFVALSLPDLRLIEVVETILGKPPADP
jgi:broad specificity phosphatase PhoE